MKMHGVRVAVLLGLLSLSPALRVFAEGPPTLRRPQILLFPGAELTVQVPPGFQGTQMLFELVTDSGRISDSWLDGIDADGKVRTQAHCTFIGAGKLRMREPNSAPDAGQEIEIDCSLAHSAGEASSAPSAFGLRAVATLATEPPVAIPGQLESLVFQESGTDTRETTLTRGDGESKTFSRTLVSRSNVTIQNGRRDASGSVTEQNCCSSTRGSAHDEPGFFNSLFDCGVGGLGCFPLPPVSVEEHQDAPLLPYVVQNVRGGSGNSNFETRQHNVNTNDSRQSVLVVQTTRGNYASEFRLKWVFPNLPEGERLATVAIEAEPTFPHAFVLYAGPLDSYQLDVLETSRSVTPQPIGLPTGACPSTSVPKLRWQFEGPTEGNQVTVRMIAAGPGCSYSDNPPPERIEGRDGYITTTRTSSGVSVGLVASYRATTVVPPLMIAPDKPVLAPTWPARTSDPNALGDTATQIKATLVDVDPGDYTVNIRIDDFEINHSGHAGHGPAPTHVWGTFDQSVDGEIPQTECEITVDLTRSGTCRVDFQADEVAGRVKLVATTTIAGKTEEAKADLDVRVEGLINFQSLPGELGGFDRNPANDIGHPDSVAFSATPLAAARLLAMMADHLRLTREEVSIPNHPYGLVFRVNDMSLPWGGVFDHAVPWRPPHAMHRNGKSVDINREVIDALDVFDEDPATIDLGRALIDLTCLNGGGRIIREPSIHCEFDRD